MLTDLDKKILYSLDQNGRKSLSEIAKETKTTPQVVKYRLENMLEKKVIKNFWAFIDYNKVGYDYFWAYWLSFHGANKEKREEIFTYLKKHKNFPIVFRTDGYADAMTAIIAKDLFEHNKLLNDFLEKFEAFIQIKETSVGVAFRKFGRAYLLDNPEEATVSRSGKPTKEIVKIDKTDSQIISLSQINGRIKFSEIGEALDIDANKARRHYEKLVKKGVIKKTTYNLNSQEAGIRSYRLLVKIHPNKEKSLDFFNFCKKHPNIINYIHTIGNFQAMLDIEVKNREELRELIQEIHQNFLDIVKRVEINEIYKIEKFSQMAIEHPELEQKISTSPWKVSENE